MESIESPHRETAPSPFPRDDEEEEVGEGPRVRRAPEQSSSLEETATCSERGLGGGCKTLTAMWIEARCVASIHLVDLNPTHTDLQQPSWPSNRNPSHVDPLHLPSLSLCATIVDDVVVVLVDEGVCDKSLISVVYPRSFGAGRDPAVLTQPCDELTLYL